MTLLTGLPRIDLPAGSDAKAVTEAVTRVAGACRGAGLSESVAAAVELATEEVLQNVMTHGGADATVSLVLGNDTATVVVCDSGPPFDPWSDAPEPVLTGPPESRPVGGLGIHLARRLMDRVGYRRDGNRNVVELVKHVGLRAEVGRSRERTDNAD